MKIPSYDPFEKVLTAVIFLITALGFYYAKTIYMLANARIYEGNVLTNVLLFILIETALLNGVLLYTLIKKRGENDVENR